MLHTYRLHLSELSPMTRYAPVLGSHFYQILSTVAVCPSLNISMPCRLLAGSSLSSPGLHCGSTWQLETEDWSSKAILAQNRGGRPATYESWTGDCEATRSGPIGLAELRGNCYVVSRSQTRSWRERERERCYAERGIAMASCLFVRLWRWCIVVIGLYIGWNSWKIISRLISLTFIFVPSRRLTINRSQCRKNLHICRELSPRHLQLQPTIGLVFAYNHHMPRGCIEHLAFTFLAHPV